MIFLANIGLFVVKLLLLFFVLGVIILVHEFGHFIWAKKCHVHIYEFSIGMGPVLFKHTGKDKIDYNFRAIPIGGFVSMAGEVYEDDNKIKKDKLLCNKPWYQRLIILCAGVINNFILAIVLLSVYTAIWGGEALAPVIDKVSPDSAAEKAGFEDGDRILAINGNKVTSWDKAQIVLCYKTKSDTYTFKVKHDNGTTEVIKVIPDKIKSEDGKTERNVFGIAIAEENTNSIIKVISYSFRKFIAIVDSMFVTLWGLISGKIALNNLSGPVGIYSVVGASTTLSFAKAVRYIMYLIAYLSINVGIINILPFPAFDGGHVLFLLIEVIRKKPIDSKIENTIHMIGFILVLLLMIVVSISDILKLF